ncbi:type VII secretion protein EccCa [Micromonospora sp. HUAS LYJ1]|uniref:type VII secretion protein EccCa n=1 Tax=Micromonospora sp. HUAS LYJ1 TaxID=3061626 RepID=UPI0026734E50|nr:type VII secretion protein EccCa [Micromonospora sp. HUAS LYJ1]WKU05346.1 type VII secretion protein EccCa [Micromonospora sp. HUAS LYJ1]
MSVVTVKRRPRADAPPLPDDQVELQEPPVMAEAAQPDLRAFAMVIPMGLGMGGMFLLYGMSNRSPVMYVMGIIMGVGMLGMGAMQIGRNAADRKTKMRGERRDFLRYIAQIRRRARESAQQQRQAVLWNNPAPGALWSIAMGSRIWERRASHDDFARVRIGLGEQGSSVTYVAPSTKPIEDLEPLSSISLRRFGEAYRTVSGVPISVGLRSVASVELEGQLDHTLPLARAMIAQLVTFHAPDELRVAVLCSEAEREKHWDWVKWLPHNAHPTAEDEAGPVRLFAADHDDLFDLLGPELLDRGDDRTVSPSVTDPYILIVAHHTTVPDGSRLLGQGIRNVGLLDLTNRLPGGPRVLRLTVHADRVEFPAGDAKGSAVPDAMTLEQAETLARVLAPKRTSGTLELVDEPMNSDFELTTLLGVRDPHTYDIAGLTRARQAQRARLQVPIGVTEDGEVVELDLKESAQGGMGPHGLVIGATGSGKSELLRTLVCALAMTHSSDILNLVLVDFKGGATFLGMERLPHTSAVITNLADELQLVDRMQDALNGELTRRQELLRASGYASLFDYEKARGAGAPLAPLPVLLVVVDEFSELLSSKPEFMDLFVSIGRLGRSLGVHLLLASQRLDEGRINRVEGHLSYRIALRTFSSMESRSVIGVGSAYELPSEPGNGYLKMDTTSLIRFKGAYVSGPYERPAAPLERDAERERALVQVVPFTSGSAARPRRRPPTEAADGGAVPAEPVTATETAMLMDVIIARLEGSGPPARQVWLPPLAESPSLDSLLPSVVPDAVRGMGVEAAEMHGRLRVPVGVVDRPGEQLRDLLVADLAGAEGHVGIAGAPQSGKSTLLRTIVLALALTHTPYEVQVYGLDFGGGGIASLAGLPHVGSIATRMERDRVVRTIQELRQVMERREAAFAEHGFESIGAYLTARAEGRIYDPHGRVFLVVDGWFTMKQDFADLDQAFGELASRGLSFGIHVLVTANRWSEVRTWVRDLLGTKLELRLGDAMESEVGSRRAATVPAQAGRGLTSAGLHFLAALPRLDGRTSVGDLAEATKAIVEEIATFWPGEPAPPVRLLPSRVPVAALPSPQPDLQVCLGLDEQRLAPVWHNFMVTPHLLVLGDNETGKTNILRLVLRAIRQRYTPEQAKVVVGDSRRDLEDAVPGGYRVGYAITGEGLAELAQQAAVSLGRRLPSMDVAAERLRRRDWWEGPELFVVVDDYELLGGPAGGSALTPLLPMIAQGVAVGFHLIVARSTSGAMTAMRDPAIRRMWELGTPATLLSYPKDEGRFLGEATPRKLPPGRAQLVTRRGVQLIQTGEVDRGDEKL